MIYPPYFHNFSVPSVIYMAAKKSESTATFNRRYISNVNTGKIECSDVDLDIGYTISKRDGDAVAWTKEKRPVGLK